MTIAWRPLESGEVDHERLWVLVGIVALGLGAAAARTIGVPPIACPFKAITGFACPTCGGSRALVALATGHLARAVRLNPLVTSAALGWAAYIPYGIVFGWSGMRRPRAALSAREAQVLRALAVLVVAAAWLFLILDGR